MSERLEILGGRFDGGDVAQRPDEYVWIGGLARPRCFKRPGTGRELYRRRAGRFECVERTHRHCSCGSFISAPVDECPWCGAPLREANRAAP